MHLSIGFKDQPFSGSLREDFLSALRSEGASGLRSVAFMIELMAADVDGSLDVGQFGASIGTIFSRLPLCDVNIVMRDISLPEVSTAGMPFPSLDGGDQRAIAYNRVASPRGNAGRSPLLRTSTAHPSR
ncbi:hypothetical protein GSI_14311 [Ganoderma sinense ZZ0214-1]|uniref:Uncharacterized protein n=1 Tax=Ganoderma sinense ZZ0214-1 TaxID=1077348 RepID=A0A2G8RNB3_9APHY|nr:hypothetical protein GSI_14311 [Ganoderma sinense ZZ0214-1]